MEARSQSVAHPNENEFHFQLECLLMEGDAANREQACDLLSAYLPSTFWLRRP